MSALTYTITAMTERNFGDHGAICPTAFEPLEGESVEEMILRVLPDLTRMYSQAAPTDHIIIRVTSESIARLAETSKQGTEAPF